MELFPRNGSIAKNLAPLQNQKKPSQLGKFIIFIRKKMTHKGENYSVKMQKYYFCNEPRSFIQKIHIRSLFRDKIYWVT
jgi:hypothetical protein